MSTRHARVADKELNEKHTRILIDLLQKPENKICADCRKKDPRWASWNLGIFICIRCSGTHRSLGTHISKVKSVDLDTWTAEQIESMISLGNGRANNYWEANLDNRQPSDYSMDVWIRAKYEQKRWTKKSEILNSPLSTESKDDKKVVEEVVPEDKRKHDSNDKLTKDSIQDLSAAYQTLASLGVEKNNTPVECITPTSSSTLSMEKNISPIGKSAQLQTTSVPLQTATTKNGFQIDMCSFQQQLSGLSLGRPSSGLIPQAPAGSKSAWTNFILDQNKGASNFRNKSILNEPSTEKPLISYEALASLRRS